MGTGTYDRLVPILVRRKYNLTVSTTVCYAGAVLHKGVERMAHRVNEYRKRIRISQQEKIIELQEVNASLLKKVQEQEEQIFRLSESLNQRMLGFVPKKPKRERSTTPKEKSEWQRIRANMNSLRKG